MNDRVSLSIPIDRGADLTEADIALLAEDAITVTWWCMRNRIKRDQWQEQIRQAFRVRLGRRTVAKDTVLVGEITDAE